MRDVEALIQELEQRMRNDCRRMQRWRITHRTNGVMYNLVLIFAPSVLAVGLISSETVLGKALLFAIAVVGSLNATFKPYLHSQRRRVDMNAMRRLRDEFVAEVAESAGNQEATILVYQKYLSAFSNVYELRGRGLVDATLSAAEQRELAERAEQRADSLTRAPLSGPGSRS